jgi:type IV pilus assembly protein PilV
MKNSKQCGFTLAEVLVSVFVLAIGIIGTAGMQLTALRTSQQTAFQTAAIQLASEIADKMRTNVGHFHQADDVNPFLNLDYSSSDDPLPATGKACHASSCNAEELANFEIHEWKSRVKAALPGGRIAICRDSHPWDSSTGAFRWRCTASAEHKNTSALVIKIGWHGKGRNPDGSVVENARTPAPPNMAITVAPYSK